MFSQYFLQVPQYIQIGKSRLFVHFDLKLTLEYSVARFRTLTYCSSDLTLLYFEETYLTQQKYTQTRLIYVIYLCQFSVCILYTFTFMQGSLLKWGEHF